MNPKKGVRDEPQSFRKCPGYRSSVCMSAGCKFVEACVCLPLQICLRAAAALYASVCADRNIRMWRGVCVCVCAHRHVCMMSILVCLSVHACLCTPVCVHICTTVGQHRCMCLYVQLQDQAFLQKQSSLQSSGQAGRALQHILGPHIKAPEKGSNASPPEMRIWTYPDC